MMDEIFNKSKYFDLKNELNVIRNDLNLLNNKYIKICNSLKSNINIDKKIIEQDNLKKLNTNNSNVIKEINDIVIPIINDNI